jgi:hypothetical protein
VGPPGGPNCNAQSPASPNYCTPTPVPPSGGNDVSTSPPAADPPPTPCPLNPAGQPVCSHRP